MKTRLSFTVAPALGLTLALLWLLGGNPAHVRADTYTVTNTNASGPGSLPQAILNANSNPGHDTITFIAGLSGIIVPTGTLTISDDLTMIGPGVQLAVSGASAYRVFYIGSGVAVTITKMTVRDGYAEQGGGIWSAGALYLNDMRIANNAATIGYGLGGGVCIHAGTATLSGTQVFDNEASSYGGGVYVEQATATLNGTQVFNNVADYGGGLYVYNNVTLNRTQVFSNVANYDGGGVNVVDGATFIAAQVFNNTASRSGGGVYIDYGFGITILSETQISSNTASEYGGGMYVAMSDATLNVSGGEISHNAAGIHGGGMYVSEGAATLTGTQVVSNTAPQYGGGVYVDQATARLNVSDGEIQGNTALYGGGVYVYAGAAILTDTQVLGNKAPDYDGGGIYVAEAAATLNVSGGEIKANSAGYWGGGIYVFEGSTTLSGAQVVSNTAYEGAGVYIYRGSATLNDTQVLSNTASAGGGVLLYSNTATLSVNGGEISDNAAVYGGGGVYISSGAVTLNGTQVFRNTSSSYGGGGVWSSGNVTLSGARIAQNTASPGSAIYLYSGAITPTSALTVTGDIYQRAGLFAGSNHDLRIEGALVLAGGHFYAPYEPNVFVLTGAYTHTGGTYHQIKSVNGSSPVGFPKEGGLIINANSQNLGSTQVVDAANVHCAGVTPGDAVQHCAIITPTLSTGRAATITFYYQSNEIPSGQSCASMEAYRWTGAWDTMLTRDESYGVGGRMCGSDPQSIRVAGVDAFSPFAIHEPKPADILVVPSALDFGEQDVDAGPTLSQMVTITNVGDFDLHIITVTLSGDTGDFGLADSGEITLTPGSTRTIDVAFDPASTGARGAVLTIESDDGDEASVDVILSGRGIDREIVVAPDSLAFGEQDVNAGATAPQAVIITNTGSADLHVTGIALTGNNPAAFVIASGGGAITLTSGSTHTVQLAFDPAITGAMSANLTIQSDDSDEASVDVALSGTGTSASNTYTLTVHKDGTGSGTVTSDPAGIACGASCQANFTEGTVVTLTAAADGNSTFGGWSGDCSGTGACQVTMNAARNVTATFDLTVVGQPGYGSTPAPGSTIDLGTTEVGSTISATLTIRETGDMTLTVTPTLSGPDMGDFAVPTATLTLLDGDPAQALVISCAPTLTTTRAATLTITHNAEGSPAVYALRCAGKQSKHMIFLPLVIRNS